MMVYIKGIKELVAEFYVFRVDHEISLLYMEKKLYLLL